MTTLRPERHVVTITDDTTREDLLITLGLLNDNAKRIHRRGYIGTASDAYVTAHARIDAVLGELELLA